MTEPWEEQARSIPGLLRRKLFIVGVLDQRVRALGGSVVVVGGTAVEWYTRGLYSSGDVDLLGPWHTIDGVLRGMGFDREGRHWYREDMGVAIEAPAEGLEAYRNRITVIDAEGVKVPMVSVEEAILDRLRACVHWRSQLDCEQAVHMMMVHAKAIDWAYLEQRAVRDQVVEKLAEARREAEDLAAGR